MYMPQTAGDFGLNLSPKLKYESWLLLTNALPFTKLNHGQVDAPVCSTTSNNHRNIKPLFKVMFNPNLSTKIYEQKEEKIVHYTATK